MSLPQTKHTACNNPKRTAQIVYPQTPTWRAYVNTMHAMRRTSATSPKHHVLSASMCMCANACVCGMYMHIAVHIRTHVLRSQQIAISTVNIRAHDRSSVAVDRSGLSVSSTGIRVTSRHAEQHLHHHADQYLHLSSASTCAGRHSAPVLIIWVKIVLKITSPMEPCAVSVRILRILDGKTVI